LKEPYLINNINPAKKIINPSLNPDRHVAIVTGGNRGIGYEICKELSRLVAMSFSLVGMKRKVGELQLNYIIIMTMLHIAGSTSLIVKIFQAFGIGF